MSTRCACPVLTAYGIVLNDNMPDELRDRLLKPLVPLIAGTRGTIEDELRRAKFLAMVGINKLAPLWLRAYEIPEFDALASQCEAARSDAELRAIEVAALADLADLAALADLADLAALAALADLAALAALADLAARAALAARAREQILELMVGALREAIDLGPHEGFDVAIDLVARHRALRELVAA